MENLLSNFSKLLNSRKELDTRINMFCECRDYRETPLFKKLNKCNIRTKDKLVKRLVDAANVYSKYYNKLASIEVFKTLDIILEVLELSGVSIITNMRTNKVTSQKKFMSDMQNLPMNIFYSDKFDDAIIDLYDAHLKNIEFTGLDYAKAIADYFEKDAESKIEKIADGLVAEELFIIYFVLAILGPCYKIPFRDLAYNPPDDIILPLIKDSLKEYYSFERDSLDHQCRVWLFILFDNRYPLYESIIEAREKLKIYGQMINSKTFKEYSCYKDEYYNDDDC